MAVEVFIHKMSEHMESGEIIRWLVKEGDRIERRQVIMEVMTDKVVAELEAPASGILKGIRAGAVDGATVPVGETIAFIAEPGEEVPVLPPLRLAGAEKVAKATPPPISGVSAPVRAEPGQVRATPVARKLAKELGVDLSLVKGSGPEGRIKEEDVRAFVAAAQATAPAPQPTPEAVEWLDLTPIQRLTGQRMLESVQTAPQFALTASVDTTNALWLREALMDRIVTETGERLSITALLVKIVAAALTNHPRANASFDGGRVKLHRQINMGVAVSTHDGLVVPVIKEADQKSLVQITRELKSFQDKARGMRYPSKMGILFSIEDLSGGTFTLSNLGMYGIDRFNAILNPPQSAILAVGRVIKTPVGMPGDTIALRPIMSLTLSVDHRAMDGVQGAKFLAEVKERIERPYFLL
jgi:pyruvate dehydrogenase E2 component (dihydrolipoamide acetyltransferase)